MDGISKNLYISDNGFIFDYDTGLTYGLNPTGVFTLRQLFEGNALAEITHTLENKYGISQRVVTSDIDDFLQQLSSLKLFRYSEAL